MGCLCFLVHGAIEIDLRIGVRFIFLRIRVRFIECNGLSEFASCRALGDLIDLNGRTFQYLTKIVGVLGPRIITPSSLFL